jgi:hypothetical protein
MPALSFLISSILALAPTASPGLAEEPKGDPKDMDAISRAHAWGAYHVGFTHYNPYTGFHHYGYTRLYGGGLGGDGYGGLYGYHYGGLGLYGDDLYGGYHYGDYGLGGYHYGFYSRW